jgi:hypothetical protein
MPIVQDEDDSGSLIGSDPLKKQPDNITSIEITSPSNETIVTDNRWTPRMNLLTHVEGSLWKVDYYSQVLNSDSQLSGQQLSVSASYQQYNKINQFEFKVTSPLTTTQDEESKAMTVIGAGILPPFIVPQDGDMFIADIGEGKRAVFGIIRTLKLSIYKEACYEISYQLDSTDESKILDLEAKTVNQTYYHEKYVVLGKNPIILSNEHSVILELGQSFDIMIKQYFRRFYSKEFKTLLLPSQTTSIYDHFLVDFLLSQFSTWESTEIKHITKFNMSDDDNMSCDNIWTALKYRNISYLNTAFKQIGLVNTVNFSSQVVSHGIRYTGVKKAVYPLDPVLTVDNTLKDNTKLLNVESITQPEALVNVMVRAINLRTLDITPDQEKIPLVTKDNFYVLTESFYTKAPTMSVLEGLVWSYIENSSIDKDQLLNLSKTFLEWGLLEQFYYTPIIMVMIRSALNGD